MKLAFYGDDFTGSTDALEVLAFAGERCALFLEPPSPALLARFGTLDAIGVAGDSRAMTPAEMDAQLPAVFAALARLSPIVHYKVCSTFDSAPEVGSIGHAIAIARAGLGTRAIPIVAGTPALGRYCAFAHLFARSATDGEVHRIDRHPIMRVHPVTPMHESDLRLHLARQAPLSIASFALPHLEAGREHADAHFDALVAGAAQALLFDATTDAHLTEIGRLIERQARAAAPLFVVGSSGAQYALTQWWREAGRAARQTEGFERFDAVDRVLAISGSASLASARQIEHAVEAGFVEHAIDTRALLDEGAPSHAVDALAGRAIESLGRGHSVILHTAKGPHDARIEAAVSALQARGLERDAARRQSARLLGRRLGEAARAIVQSVRLRRLLVAGGDTSGAIVKTLAPQALQVAAWLARGVPLCRLVAQEPWLDGLELALKGGQLGDEDFFESARRGRG